MNARACFMSLMLAVMAWTAGHPVHGQDAAARTFVEWSDFEVGSWKQVRVYRESFDETGKLASTSTADTKTTLVARDEKGFSLRAEVTLEVAGKRFTSNPQVVSYGYFGEPKGQGVTCEKLAHDTLDINGVKVPADVFQLAFKEGTYRRDTRAYCGELFPNVFRKQSVLVDTSGDKEKELEKVTVEVLAVNLPFRVLSELKTASHVKTLHQRPDARTLTLEVHCPDVPGRVVAHWSTTSDANGRLLERSTLELVDYGRPGPPAQGQLLPRRPLFGRNRGTRTR